MTTIEGLLNCVINQTIKPILWIVLDDGSTDGSSQVVQRFVGEHSWIQLESLSDRGFDFVGGGVAQVLNKGLSLINGLPSDYVAKVDADLLLPLDYFEVLMTAMEADPFLGICCGHPFTHERGRKQPERSGYFFPSGTARLYRRRYLEEIGYFVNSVGWDTVDLLRMQMRGYSVRTLHQLQFEHVRQVGTRRGYIDGTIRDGRNAYLTGYTPHFFVCRALFNIRFKPYLLRTICMLWGFTAAYVRRLPRAVTQEERFFHAQLLRDRLRLYLRKGPEQ